MNNYLHIILLASLLMLVACGEPRTTSDEVANTDTSTFYDSSDLDDYEMNNTRKDEIDYGIEDGRKFPKGLKVGALAPGFKGMDSEGNEVSLTSELENGPVVLMFYRGYWCPACNKYLKQFQDSIELIEDKGAKVIAVTPEGGADIEKTREQSGTNVTVVHDSDYQIMDAYDVRFSVTEEYQEKIKKGKGVDLKKSTPSTEAYLPVPATYVIGPEGRIKYTFFNYDYHKRAPVQKIIEHL